MTAALVTYLYQLGDLLVTGDREINPVTEESIQNQLGDLPVSDLLVTVHYITLHYTIMLHYTTALEEPPPASLA